METGVMCLAPLQGRGGYRVEKGSINFKSLEIIISTHNLAYYTTLKHTNSQRDYITL